MALHGVEFAYIKAGDLGNLTADANGAAHLELTLHDVSLTGDTNNIVGRTVIVHADEDDLKSQPTGNSGGRLGGGVIKLQQAQTLMV